MTLSNYFKEKSGFNRLFTKLKDKYVTYGEFKGRVYLEDLTKEEAIEFTMFFNKPYHEHENAYISFKNIEKILNNSKYVGFSWKDLFYNYFGNITTKKQVLEEKIKEEELFINTILDNLNIEEKVFFKKVRSNKQLNTLIIKRYHKEKDLFIKDLVNLIKITYNLEQYLPTSLVMLASTTGNPHFLDMNNPNGTLFIKLLAFKYNYNYPCNSLDRISLLSNLGITQDNVSNFVITYKLTSNSKFIQSFSDSDEILNLNLSNLLHINNLDTLEKNVYIFENPSLIETLKYLNLPIIITSGMPNYALYRVIDLLLKSNNKIYYNGDFDPEGLLIAEKLKERYPTLNLFCYSKNDYLNSKSSEIINDSRIHKLNNISNKDLYIIKNLLINNRLSGYQERNINNIKRFITNQYYKK